MGNKRHEGSKWEYEKRAPRKKTITNIKKVQRGQKDNRTPPGCAVVVLAGAVSLAGVIGAGLAVKGLA